MPRRIQLKRTRGWRMPADAVKVDRSTRWGNPFRPSMFEAALGAAGEAVDAKAGLAAAVAAHDRWLRGEQAAPDGRPPPSREALRAALAGRDLACWCPLDGPCHADRLLAIANGEDAD